MTENGKYWIENGTILRDVRIPKQMENDAGIIGKAKLVITFMQGFTGVTFALAILG